MDLVIEIRSSIEGTLYKIWEITLTRIDSSHCLSHRSQGAFLGKMRMVAHVRIHDSTMKQRLLDWLNLILVADVFLVLLSFAWLAIAVTGHGFGVSLGLDLWYKLWEPVFTPAIGILMGGAILSGIISQINKRLLKRE